MVLLTVLFMLFHVVYNSDINEPINKPTSDLRRLVETNRFVDKTNILKVFLDSKLPIILITAPPGFGKTINMQIIKTFFELFADKNGKILRQDLTPNYELYEGYDFKIHSQRLFTGKFFARYPVIHLDFERFDYSSFESFMKSFKREISSMFALHKYLSFSDKLDEEERKTYNEFFNETEIDKMNHYDLKNCILALSYMLHNHFNERKCLLLIENYDVLAKNAIFNSGAALKGVYNFTYQFLTAALDSNPFIRKTLINSCIRIGPTLPFDHIEFLPFLDQHIFTSFYGFTKREVQQLLQKEKLTHHLKSVFDWYGGYSYTTKIPIMHNPLSILTFVENRRLHNYWANSSDLIKAAHLFSRKEIRHHIDRMLEKTTDIDYFDVYKPKNLFQLYNTIHSAAGTNLTKVEVDFFLQLVTDLGFLKITFAGYNEDVELTFTNQEAKEFITSRM